MIARVSLLLLSSSLLLLASPESEWKEIIAMDSGPCRKPTTRDEAIIIARAHLLSQKKLIEDFIRKYPEDSHRLDARLHQAAILATLGNIDSTPRQISEALGILSELELSSQTPADRKPDIGFRRVSLFLQTQRGKEFEKKDLIVRSAVDYAAKYPGDRRNPRLFVEVATVCDSDPLLKRKLLEKAKSLSTEEPLNRRIADDLKRLDMLGKPFQLSFTTTQGRSFHSTDHIGQVIVLIFWSAESPQCLVWLREFKKNISRLPPSPLMIATVSLDTRRDEFSRRVSEFGMEGWPTNFEGTGWESEIARPLGINSLPTIFLIDKSGVLRNLNAQSGYMTSIQNLLGE